jgi:hypothetical protein
VPTFSAIADQQQIELKLVMWKSLADDAICREWDRASVDRSPERISGRSP